jgi:hypothetical protein
MLLAIGYRLYERQGGRAKAAKAAKAAKNAKTTRGRRHGDPNVHVHRFDSG